MSKILDDLNQNMKSFSNILKLYIDRKFLKDEYIKKLFIY